MIVLEKNCCPSTATYPRNFGAENYAKANIIKKEDSVSIVISAPGFKKEQMVIKVDNNTVSVVGTINEQENKNYTRQEFVPKSFERYFEVSKHYDTEAISAKFEQGIIEITIPMKEQKNNSKQIIIN
jgi:HSP20 family protein